MSCSFCTEPPSPELWWAWQEDSHAALQLAGDRRDELRLHMESHRPAQPARPGPWRSRDWKGAAEKLSARQRRILYFLCSSGALSIEQLALLLFGEADQKSNAKVSQDMRILLRSQFVYRLFPEHLPGEGPRPSRTPALFFLGKSSRVLLEGLRKKQDWFESLDDFRSWHEPFDLWQRAGRATELIYPAIEPRALRTHGLRQTLRDSLLGRVSVAPDSLLVVRHGEKDFSLFLFRDNHMRSAEDEVRRILRFDALLRNNPPSTPALALVVAKDAERGKELLGAAAKHTLPRSTTILVSPRSETAKKSPRWKSLVHEEAGPLEQFLLGKSKGPS